MPRSPRSNRGVVATLNRPSTSLTAAAKVYSTVGDPGPQALRQVRSTGWQAELWDYYNTVPELWSAANWVGNLLSKARLEVHENGKPTTNVSALDALASLFGGPVGQREMFRLLGINFTVAGEAFTIAKPRPGMLDKWDVVASTKVSGEDTRNMTVEGVTLPEGALPIRLWRQHPERNFESDCPARALMNDFAQAVKLTQVINSIADSRLKGNGILWVPSELEPPAVPILEEFGEDEELQSLQELSTSQSVTARMIKIAAHAMLDRNSAAASVPLVIAAPGEYLEKVQWTDFWTGFDEHLKTLRDDVTHRIALGMDMPPEALTGTGDMNHWGAFAVGEDAVKIHTEPLLEIVIDALRTGYLLPFLRDEGVANYEDFTFYADTSKMRARPNRSKEALELWDRGELASRTLLEETGFDPEKDAPSREERIMFLLSNMARKTSGSPDQLAAVMDRLGVTGLPIGDGEARGALDTPSLEEHPRRREPDPEESEAGVIRAGAALPIDGLVLAAEQMVYRALERAGNRIKAKVGRNIGSAAADLYLSVPTMDYSECEQYLQDAWTALDRFDYPGVATARLREALHEYALMLMRSQKPLTRASLARHLMLELADS